MGESFKWPGNAVKVFRLIQIYLVEEFRQSISINQPTFKVEKTKQNKTKTNGLLRGGLYIYTCRFQDYVIISNNHWINWSYLFFKRNKCSPQA